MMGLSLVLAGLIAVQAPAPSAPRAPAQPAPLGSRVATDQTVPIARGGRVQLSGCATAVVRTWNRDEVRVRAAHGRRTQVRVAAMNQAVLVSAGPGPMTGTEFELTVPSWVGLAIEGVECAADVDGIDGPVSIGTVEADIVLRGLTGTVEAHTVEGAIYVEGGSGRVRVNTVEGDIVLRGAAGEISAESIDGDVIVEEARSAAVEASTIDGDIRFRGTIAASGRYRFTTHDGDVWLTIPGGSSATFAIRTHEGTDIDSVLPLTLASGGRSGRRMIYTLGGGSAQVEIETFDGTVHVRRE